MNQRPAEWAAAAAGILTIASVAAIAFAPVTLHPGSAAWQRLVRGPTAEGVVYPGVAVLVALPGLPRGRAREVIIDGGSLDAAPSILAVSVDGAAPIDVAVDARRAARIAIPPAGHGGLRLEIAARRGAPPAQLRGVRVSGGWPPLLLVALAAVIAAGATAVVARVERLDRAGALAIAVASAAGAAAFFLVASGAVAFGAAGRAAVVPVALTVIAVAVGARSTPRRAVASGAAVVAALAFGAAARWFFAPSSGSWDLDYYRVWIETAIARGVTGAYGPPLEVSAVDAALGRAGPLWAPQADGRIFNIDYPPLAVALWRVSAAFVSPADDAAWNVAMKLPAMLGDVAALLLLAFAWPGGRAGLRAAALYWAIPSSWLSSAALGYLDGAYGPILLVSALAAASGRPIPAGAALALAALIKPTALVASPAILVALAKPRRILLAVLGGLAVVAIVMLPFAVEGTAGAAIAQVRKILSQERLSAGYANPWWLAGAALSGQVARVGNVVIAAAPFPARAIALLSLFAVAALITRALARSRGPGATAAACGALFAAYAVLATSVHVNHPHPVGLMLLAALAVGAAPRRAALVIVHGYALNILFNEGFGRVAGPRFGAVSHSDAWIDRFRFGTGVDLTLLLAVVHTVALAALVAGLHRPARATPSD